MEIVSLAIIDCVGFDFLNIQLRYKVVSEGSEMNKKI